MMLISPEHASEAVVILGKEGTEYGDMTRNIFGQKA